MKDDNWYVPEETPRWEFVEIDLSDHPPIKGLVKLFPPEEPPAPWTTSPPA